MVVLKSATFGDEFSNTDVLKSLQEKVTESGSIDVDVDSSLIPLLDKATGAGVTALSDDEKRDIKGQAEQICGPNDQTCLEIKTQELAQARLKEKQTESITAANIIKGRRLTVKYVDETGERTAVIPEGQKFALGEAGGAPDPNFDWEAATSPWRQFFSSIWGIIGTALTTFLYATSLIITWMTFSELGNTVAKVIAMLIAVFIPLSGFGVSFVGAMFPSYFSGDRELRARISGQ